MKNAKHDREKTIYFPRKTVKNLTTQAIDMVHPMRNFLKETACIWNSNAFRKSWDKIYWNHHKIALTGPKFWIFLEFIENPLSHSGKTTKQRINRSFNRREVHNFFWANAALGIQLKTKKRIEQSNQNGIAPEIVSRAHDVTCNYDVKKWTTFSPFRTFSWIVESRQAKVPELKPLSTQPSKTFNKLLKKVSREMRAQMKNQSFNKKFPPNHPAKWKQKNPRFQTEKQLRISDDLWDFSLKKDSAHGLKVSFEATALRSLWKSCREAQ